MRLLVYMQPWIEKNKPSYRIQSFLKDQKTIIDCFLKHSSSIEVHCVIGDALKTLIGDELSEIDPQVNIHVISQHELRENFKDNKSEAAVFYQEPNSKTSAHFHKFEELLGSKLGDFTPDVIFTFECYDTHLRAVYPQAVVINQYFSPFSREPFPRLTCFDTNGIFKNSFTTLYSKELRAIRTTPNSDEFMDEIRRYFFEGLLQEYDYTQDYIQPYKDKFDFLVSLPMQGSNYFAFECNSGYTNLFDYICYVLDRIDPRIGVVITEHSAHETVITEDLCRYLRKTYPNFIYIEELNKYSFHSQQVLCHTDAVLTVSSSLSFLAAMQKKAAFCIGKFESFVSQGNRVEDIYRSLSDQRTHSFDGAFEFLFKHFYFRVSKTRTSKELYSYLESIIQNASAGKHGVEIYKSALTGLSRADHITTIARKEKYISKLPSCGSFSVRNHGQNGRQAKCLSPSQLHRSITGDQYDIISFDMFDTLVVRPFTKPRHLFSFMTPEVQSILGMERFDFEKARTKTEKQLRQAKKARNGTWDEVHIDEIYSELEQKLGWNSRETQKIKELEKQTELELCAPAQTMLDFFKCAVATNKRVVITTDIYLDETLIRQILKSCGFKGYDYLFVSSTYGRRKQDGRLYQDLIDTLAVSPERILHIGDNQESDGVWANTNGIDCCLIDKPVERLLPKSGRLSNLSAQYEGSRGSSEVFGTLSNMLGEHLGYQSAAKDMHGNGSPYMLGATLLGPLLYSFSNWLFNEAERLNIGKLHFLSREGKLLKDAYDLIRKPKGLGPPSNYLLASRRAALAASIKSRADINSVVFKKMTKTNLKHILEYKLGLSSDDHNYLDVKKYNFYGIDAQVDLQDVRHKLMELLDELEDVILHSATRERLAMLEYFQEKQLCTGKQPEALVDIGYSGTIQSCLQNITNTPLWGLYVGVKNSNPSQNRLRKCGFLFDETCCQNNQIAKAYESYTKLFESLFCEANASFYKFTIQDNKVTAIFNDGEISSGHKRLINQLHKGALDYVDYAISHIPSGTYIEREILINNALDFFGSPHPEEAALFAPVSFDNRMGDVIDKLLVPTNPTTPSNSSDYIWKEGARSMLNACNQAGDLLDIKSMLTYA